MIFLEYIGIGLTAAMFLIITSKVIMGKLLQRKPDFYEEKIREGGEADE